MTPDEEVVAPATEEVVPEVTPTVEAD